MRDRDKLTGSLMFQILNVALLGLVAYLLQHNFEGMNVQIAQNRLDHQQLRLEYTEFTAGSIGNRFTRDDWLTQKDDLTLEHQKIQQQINDLRKRVERIQ